MRILTSCAALAILAATAACDRSNPPSEKMKDAMVDAVEAVSTTTPASVPARPEGRFAPRDECTDIAGAPTFVASLRKAVDGRDEDALAALASDDILLDFGGSTGTKELRRRLDDPDYMLWDVLDELQGLGCAAYDDGNGSIALPWYFAQDLGLDDPFSVMIVTGERVPLYKTASANSEVLESISWDVVELDGGLMPDAGFQKVKSPSGAVGFMADDSLRSEVAYRLIAAEEDGRWQITALVAGD